MAIESLLERTLPQSVEAEMSVLGAMLLDNEVISLVIPLLSKGSFYKTAHQELYQTIVDVYDKGQAVDLVVLREELKNPSLAYVHLFAHENKAYSAPLAVPTFPMKTTQPASCLSPLYVQEY